MDSGTAERLASTILDENKHLVEFEVDPMDEEVASVLARALIAYGCEVRRMAHTRLRVVCPQEMGRGKDISS